MEPTDTTPDEPLSPNQEHAATQAREAIAHTLKSPLDQALSRPNARPAEAPRSLFDARQPLAIPSLTLDPNNIRAHDQFERLGGYHCDAAIAAMEALHTVAKQCITARDTYKGDVTLTEAAQVLAVDDLHGKQAPLALRKVDAAVQALDSAIGSHEQQLRASIKEGATGPFAAEIRTMVRGMTLGERMSFVTTAVTNNDAVAVGAVLGAPSYLSGLDAGIAQSLTERANAIRNPEIAARLALMKHALNKVQAAAGVFLGSTEAMCGFTDATVRKLRAQRAKVKTVIGAIVPVA